MNRQEIHAGIQEALGLIVRFFENMPDDSLEPEWALFKTYVLSADTAIPPKYRELNGVAAAASRQCWYCSNFHSGVAKLHGATDEEVQEAVLVAKMGAGWSTYLNGTVYDRDLFMRELQEVGGYLSNKLSPRCNSNLAAHTPKPRQLCGSSTSGLIQSIADRTSSGKPRLTDLQALCP